MSSFNNSGVIIDALPYADDDYTPDVANAVQAMIQSEMKTFRPRDYLAHLPPVPKLTFENDPVLAAEFERLKSKTAMEKLDMGRYELPAPPPASKNDLASWQAAVSNSRAQLEHQTLRIVNLEIFSEYGTNAWKAHVEGLKQTSESLNRSLNAMQQEVDEINRQRKNEQLGVRGKLIDLEERWWTHISKNYELELACLHLEREVEHIKRQYGLHEPDGQQQH